LYLPAEADFIYLRLASITKLGIDFKLFGLSFMPGTIIEFGLIVQSTLTLPPLLRK
jgi:hypothetical protein